MPPIIIETMLVCYYSPEPAAIKSNWHSPACVNARKLLINEAAALKDQK